MASASWLKSNSQSPFWKEPVSTASLLPLSGVTTGEIRLVLDSEELFVYDGSAWVQVTSITDLVNEVEGVLDVGNGGTNSSAPLTNDKVVVTTTGAIVESDITTTELGYLDGVTSNVQDQLDTLDEDKLDLAGGTMTGALTLSIDPSTAMQAATKQYVDNVAAGLAVKSSVKCATTENITLSGEQTIDGILTSSSRVLVKNQSSAEQNGIYLSSAGVWTRVTDMDVWDEVPGAFVFVNQGTTLADTHWVSISNSGGTIDSTAIEWTQFSGVGTYTTDGQGLEISSRQFALELDGSTLAKSGTGLKVANGGISDSQVAGDAAISRSKLASGNADHVLINAADGTMSSEEALSISRGGSGQSSANAALNAFLPTQNLHGGKYLKTDGSNTSWADVFQSPLDGQGQLIYGGTLGTPQKLAASTSDNVLMGGTAPSWGKITNTHIGTGAAIAYSKLNLSNAVLDADISSSTTISGSKLQAASENNSGTVPYYKFQAAITPSITAGGGGSTSGASFIYDGQRIGKSTTIVGTLTLGTVTGTVNSISFSFPTWITPNRTIVLPTNTGGGQVLRVNTTSGSTSVTFNLRNVTTNAVENFATGQAFNVHFVLSHD
jgi:hypothetical protein